MPKDPNEAMHAANQQLLKSMNRNYGCLKWLYSAELLVYILFIGIPVLLVCGCCGWYYIDTYLIK